MPDLVVLTADLDMENALKGILGRCHSLGTRRLSTTIYRHSEHDPGCALRGVDFLSLYADQYDHGLLIFDHEGSGKELTDHRELQEDLNEQFVRSAWGTRARAIVISPELESWIWSDSPVVDSVLGWRGQPIPLRRWLSDQKWLSEDGGKPQRPKEALEAALRVVRTPLSASLYLQIAERVSLSRCVDPAFLELKSLLQEWFGIQGTHPT